MFVSREESTTGPSFAISEENRELQLQEAFPAQDEKRNIVSKIFHNAINSYMAYVDHSLTESGITFDFLKK